MPYEVRGTEAEAHVMTEAKTGVSHATKANRHHGSITSAKNWKAQGRILPRVLEKAYSMDTLILDFWHTELGRINSCYFKPPRLWYLVMVALKNKYIQP